LKVETRAGVLPIGIDVDAGKRPIVTMTQAPAAFAEFRGDREALAAALGIGATEIFPELPVLYGSTGLWTLVVPVRSLAAIRRMVPRNAAFPDMLVEMPGASVHPFCLETIDPTAHVHARHFSSPRSGTVEDAVTGTASGVLGAYHREFICPDGGPSPLVVEQGQEVGRDGRVLVWAERRGESYEVRIAGTGCYVGELTIGAEAAGEGLHPSRAATAT
jgi:PhzF family phenazine biosynthesis protein